MKVEIDTELHGVIATDIEKTMQTCWLTLNFQGLELELQLSLDELIHLKTEIDDTIKILNGDKE